jgi:ADP-heptose:LPS heptosyltransferase
MCITGWALGANVFLEVPDTLMDLLVGLEGVDELFCKGNPLPEFDYHCPLMSLPLAFKTGLNSIPGVDPYLFSNKERREYWFRQLGKKTKQRVGLVWSGSTGHKSDRCRSLTLAELIKYLPENIEFVSLQKEVREADREVLAGSPVKHYGERINDFSDTAALCDLMDMVVSVDTSVAHLAGALGVNAWILLAYSPDWRWLMDRDDSPWYPSVKLYRQGRQRQWGPVLRKVSDDLIGLGEVMSR